MKIEINEYSSFSDLKIQVDNISEELFVPIEIVYTNESIELAKKLEKHILNLDFKSGNIYTNNRIITKTFY